LIIGGKIGDRPNFIYRCSKGIINAGLNGAIGIIKKVVPEALDLLIERRNRGAGFAPFKVVNTF